MRDNTNKCRWICVLLLCLVTNYLFFQQTLQHKSIYESENVTVDAISAEEIYSEILFEPQYSFLQDIKLRLTVEEELKESIKDIALLLSIYDGEELIVQKEVKQDQLVNKKFCSVEVNQQLRTSKNYTIRVEQIAGEPYENEVEVKYTYGVISFKRILLQFAIDILFVGALLVVFGKVKVTLQFIRKVFKKPWEYISKAFCCVFKKGIIITKKVLTSLDKVKTELLCLGMPLLTFVVVECITAYIFTIEFEFLLKNLVIYYVIFGILLLLVKNVGMLSICYLSTFVVLALLQYFVTLFRGRAFMLQDLVAIKTAMTVAGTYKFSIGAKVFLMLMFCIGLICVLGSWNFVLKRKVLLKKGIFLGGIAVFSAGVFIAFPGVTSTLNMWDLSGNYAKMGYIYTLISETQYLSKEEPENYAVDTVTDIAEGIQYDKDTASEEVQNIILIMNESFSDLEYINAVETNAELLPFLKSLQENTIKGYVHVPVFGAGTSNVEYEVLTGNSMQFALAGSTPYQMNVSENEYGMATTLNKQGFKSIALHPYLEQNWNRKQVYSCMQFDEFYAEENWENRIEYLRWCATDEEVYENLIRLCEEEEDKLFLFTVTMQNHGGYGSSWDDFENTISLDYDVTYPETEQYLSLLQESDRAFAELINYFSGSNEKTMIIMFGDHQASIENSFYEQLFGNSLTALSFEESQNRYVTPFYIWTNYDIEEASDIRMSTNYFGSYILEQAGVQLTKYNEFLLALVEEIPVIGIGGCYTKEGRWYTWNDLPEEYQQLLEQYEMLQYNNVFDRRNRIEEIFTIQ